MGWRCNAEAYTFSSADEHVTITVNGFAFGSMTLLSSFAILKGPRDFATSLIKPQILPYSAAYGVGLVGTMVATISLKSVLLTIVFGSLQALAFLYFVTSCVFG